MQSGIVAEHADAGADTHQQEGATAKEAAHKSGSDEQAPQQLGRRFAEEQGRGDDLQANRADGDQHDREGYCQNDRNDQQRQEEDEIDKGKPCQGRGRSRQVRQARFGFETPQPYIGAQFPGNPRRIAKSGGNGGFISAIGNGIGEMG